MAGTRPTPPPMPSRPTSTPTPSPSKRIMNIMVTGLFRASRPDEADQAPLFSSDPPSAATSLEQEVTLENACPFFVSPEPAIFTCLCHVGLLPAGGCAVACDAVSPKT